ncbi:MAG: SAM-dependent methyltransferase, partial [Chloroflexota bacterium]|nr:SAM-dependent methyltransferase [Chloroflexota bacterium]
AGPAGGAGRVPLGGGVASFRVVPGHDAQAAAGVDWERIAGTPGSIVVLMGVGNLGTIAGKLIAGGRSPDEPVRVVERATLPGQRVLSGTLATIEQLAQEAGLKAPAVIVVGPVAGVLNDSETT